MMHGSHDIGNNVVNAQTKHHFLLPLYLWIDAGLLCTCGLMLICSQAYQRYALHACCFCTMAWP